MKHGYQFSSLKSPDTRGFLKGTSYCFLLLYSRWCRRGCLTEGLLNKLQKLRTQLHNSKRHYYYANFNGYPFPAVRKETDFHHKSKQIPRPLKQYLAETDTAAFQCIRINQITFHNCVLQKNINWNSELDTYWVAIASSHSLR